MSATATSSSGFTSLGANATYSTNNVEQHRLRTNDLQSNNFNVGVTLNTQFGPKTTASAGHYAIPCFEPIGAIEQASSTRRRQRLRQHQPHFLGDAVYETFFGLTGKPFQLNPDPAFYFGSRGHKRAFAYLQYGLHQSEGFIVITGEIGAGKTTLVRNLLAQVDPTRLVAAQLVSTQLDADDLLRAVATSFGLPTNAVDKARLLAELEAFLVSLVPEGKRALLIVDEAQNLSGRAVEELRMLSNFQLGNQGLAAKLPGGTAGTAPVDAGSGHAATPPAGDRVVPPGADGSRRDAGLHRASPAARRLEGGSAFRAWRVRHRSTRSPSGIPRRINTLCNRLMLAAFLSEKHEITAADVEATADEIKSEMSGGSRSHKVPRT